MECKASTLSGTQCSRKALPNSDYCWQHQNYNSTVQNLPKIQSITQPKIQYVIQTITQPKIQTITQPEIKEDITDEKAIFDLLLLDKGFSKLYTVIPANSTNLGYALGKGQHSLVFLAIVNKDKSYCVVKTEDSSYHLSLLTDENNIVSKFPKNSNHLPHRIDWWPTIRNNRKRVSALVLPFYQELLQKYINDNKKLSFNILKHISTQCFLCLSECHKYGVIHRDISTNNFMSKNKFGINSELVLIDFGLATISNQLYESKEILEPMGSQLYRSANVEEGKTPTYKDDAESVCFMLWSFVYPLPWLNDSKNLYIQKLNSVLNTNLPQVLKNIIIYCRGLKFKEIPDYNYIIGELKVSNIF